MKHLLSGVMGGLIVLSSLLFVSQGSYLKPVSNQALFHTGLKIYGGQELYFRDTGLLLESSADATLDITSDSLINITAKGISLDTTVADTNVFTTTATADTVVIPGALATDIYVLTGYGASVDQQDVLQAVAKADTLIVNRLASGASGLKYSWLRIRK